MRKKIVYLELFALAISLTSCDDFLSRLNGGNNGNNTNTVTEATLERIEVTTPPTKVKNLTILEWLFLQFIVIKILKQS